MRPSDTIFRPLFGSHPPALDQSGECNDSRISASRRGSISHSPHSGVQESAITMLTDEEKGESIEVKELDLHPDFRSKLVA